MRRRHKRRATWFPILGFDTGAAAALGAQSTVDVRSTSVSNDGSENALFIPIIPDVTVPPEQLQTPLGDAGVVTTLRDFVEGQTCIIERVVGNIQHELVPSIEKGSEERIIVCSAIAVIPTADDGSGNPAVSAPELDPLRADNSSQPWLWRRVWILGDEPRMELTIPAAGTRLPQNNLFGSVAEGSKIDTKGTRRAIRREQRLFLIHSFLNAFPSAEGEARVINSFADLRVIGRLVRSTNKSTFK